jgi:hypothetical protein
MSKKWKRAGHALSLAILGALIPLGAASAQVPSAGTGAAPATGSAPPGASSGSDHARAWGLPPPPPGIGPVSLFADIHDAPQGKFLEGAPLMTQAISGSLPSAPGGFPI